MQSAEMQEIRQLARQFAQSELRPHTEQWDQAAAFDAQVVAQLAELGFFGMLIPEAHGGMQFDYATYASVIEELAWGEPSIALTVVATSLVADVILRHGSDQQQGSWLEAMARGEALAGYALTGAGATFDATAVSTRATRDGAGWLLNGQESWIINGRRARLALVLARTAGEQNGGGMGAFLVPTDSAGYHVGKREQTMGLRPVEMLSVQFDQLALPDLALLGNASSGFDYTAQTRSAGRLGMAAIAIGIAQAALEYATSYADVREQFDEKLRAFEGIQFKLADMATRVAAARALLQHAAMEPSARSAAMAKVCASETAMWVTTQAVQIYGGYGYMRDYPVEKLMRDAKATEILEGSNEVQRVLIANDLYRGI